MAADNHTTDDTAILSGLAIADNPSILAMEVFLRCQLDTSVHKRLQDSSENMDTITGHIVTRSLVQGELAHAIQHVKKHFTVQGNSCDMQTLVQHERKFLHEQLIHRCECACSAVDVYQELVVSCLRYNIDHSQSPNIIKNLCAKLTEVFSKRSEELENKLKVVKGFVHNKTQHLLSAMDVALASGLACVKELGEPIPGDSGEGSDHNVLNITSAETTVLQLADILMQRASIKGMTAFISEMMAAKQYPQTEIEHSDSHEQTVGQLSRMLSAEAEHKQSLATELKTFKGEGASSEENNRILELLDSIPDNGILNPEILGNYGENLLRESMYQTQLTYMTYKMKLQYERQMREMKMKIEAGQKVDLPADTGKDAEGDIHASLSIFEEILETKFEDECEVLSILDKEMKDLQMAVESGKPYDRQLINLIQTFDHELSVAQERHDIHVDVLRQEVNNIVLRLEKMVDENEKEKECMMNEYEEKITSLQDELECQKVDHEEELEQVRQDIMTAVSAIKANEEVDEGEDTGTRTTQAESFNVRLIPL